MTAARGSVLVADRDAAFAAAVAERLGAAGCDAEVADGPTPALARLSQRRFDVAVLDVALSADAGLDLVVEVRARAPGTRLVLTAAPHDLAGSGGVPTRGVDHLALRPCDPDELAARVGESLARARADEEARREREVLEARLRQRDTESKIWILRAAHALAHAVEAKDPFTAGHARRVTAYGMAIAEALGGVDLLSFRLAGDLHDVGKIGVPDDVLNKPGPLSAGEFAQVREHTLVGTRILRPLIDDETVLAVVRSHHERWDGSGYPDGLAGGEIPVEARVLAVADALDAMTSARAFREEMGWGDAVEGIRRAAGTRFDPAVVAAFDRALPALEELFHRFREEPPPRRGADGEE